MPYPTADSTLWLLVAWRHSGYALAPPASRLARRLDGPRRLPFVGRKDALPLPFPARLPSPSPCANTPTKEGSGVQHRSVEPQALCEPHSPPRQAAPREGGRSPGPWAWRRDPIPSPFFAPAKLHRGDSGISARTNADGDLLRSWDSVG